MKLIGFCGSLRKASFNRFLLNAAIELAPAGLTIDAHAIDGIPLFNADTEDPPPAAVASLRDALATAAGLLIATPEYNAGVPAVTKNVVDWLSRPPGKTVLKGKPVGLIGASPGMFGTVRAQIHLRASLDNTGAVVMPSPQVFVGQCKDKFDADGRLADEKTRAFLAKYLEALVVWIAKVSPN